MDSVSSWEGCSNFLVGRIRTPTEILYWFFWDGMLVVVVRLCV